MDRCDTCAFVYDDLGLERRRWVARHTVHQLLHHRNDIEAGLEPLERGDS